MYESLYGNFNNYGISLVLWGLFSLKTLLQDQALLHEPNVYGQQSSLQVNSFV